MSSYKEQALDLLNDFIKEIPFLELNEFESKYSTWIEVYDEDNSTAISLSVDDLDDVGRKLWKDEYITVEEIVDAIQELYSPNVFSEKVRQDLRNAINESFGISYQRSKGIVKHYKQKLEALNKEAGTELFSAVILDNAIEAATEFYESSRCW